MAIGTSRRVTIGNETSGWGGFYTTVKTTASASATSLVINGAGGVNYGCAAVAAGQKVFFLEDLTETPKAITNVSVSGGDATLTIAALTNQQAAGKKVLIAYAPTEALLLDAFSSNRNLNKWSTSGYTGTRAKNTSRRQGHIESDGSMQFMLRPTTNIKPMVKATGQEIGVTGTAPGTPVNTTLNGATTVGATSVTVTSATGLANGDFIQIDTYVAGSKTPEVRKITNVSTNTLTLDVALKYAHANTVAVAKVIAPFIHTIPSAATFLSPCVLEDYIPYDGSAADTVTSSSYLLTGVLFKSLKVEGNSEQGLNVTCDYDAQDKIEIPASSAITMGSEQPFIFQQEAVLIGGTRNYRVSEASVEVSNDIQKAFTKNGSNRAFTMRAGQQEVKGSIKVIADDGSQDTFWAALENDTQLALVWTVTDASTGYYVKFSCPKIVIEDFKDGDFSPADLIYATMDYTAILDTTTNAQFTLEIGNDVYLEY